MIKGTHWTQKDAIAWCRMAAYLLQPHGWLVALAGGCLLKDTPRPDLDVIVMRHSKHLDALENTIILALGRGGLADQTYLRPWGYKVHMGKRRIDINVVERPQAMRLPDDATL
jgi:hypothetical protein